MKKKIIALSLAAVLALSFTACGGEKKKDNQTVGGTKDGFTIVKVGVCGSTNDQWDTVNELLAKDNIKCEIVEFSAYNLPNEALNNGELDMNAFQHIKYFNGEVEAQGYELAILGNTIIAPLSIYSQNIKSLSDLKEGDKIAVPNDPTNEGRCFKILESAGLLTVDPNAGYSPELKDITSNPLNLQFVEVEAAMTASSLPDVACAFINGAHAADHGLTPADAIYTEQAQSGSDNPYINILAVRAGDENNEVYRKVLAAYQTKEVAEAILTIYNGLYIPAFQY